jgi:hypothetical protein
MIRKYKLINDKDADNLEELESISVFDQGFEDFLDTLDNSNEVEYFMRNDN